MAQWKIKGYDGTDTIVDFILPGNLSRKEISIVLRMLVAKHLSVEEIRKSSLRRRTRERLSFLDERISGNTITLGENPHYTAVLLA